MMMMTIMDNNKSFWDFFGILWQELGSPNLIIHHKALVKEARLQQQLTNVILDIVIILIMEKIRWVFGNLPKLLRCSEENLGFNSRTRRVTTKQACSYVAWGPVETNFCF